MRCKSCTRTWTRFYASVEQRDDPDVARPPGDRRRRGSCSPPATRPRPRREDRDGGARLAGCARTPWWCRPDGAYSRGSAAVSGVSRLHTDRGAPLGGRGVSRCRRAGRVSGTPVQIAERLRADVRHRSACRSPWHRRTKFLAKVDRQEAKPDGLLLVQPDRELAFLHPLLVRRLGAWAPKWLKNCTPTASIPLPTSPS